MGWMIWVSNPGRGKGLFSKTSSLAQGPTAFYTMGTRVLPQQ